MRITIGAAIFSTCTLVAVTALASGIDTTVTGVRSYDTGLTHVSFNNNLNSGSGCTIPDKNWGEVSAANAEGIRAIALAAFLSGSDVNVVATNAPSNDRCNIVSLQIK